MSQVRDTEMYVATPRAPALTSQEYYAHVYQENQFRASVPGGDPLSVYARRLALAVDLPRESLVGSAREGHRQPHEPHGHCIHHTALVLCHKRSASPFTSEFQASVAKISIKTKLKTAKIVFSAGWHWVAAKLYEERSAKRFIRPDPQPGCDVEV